MHMKTVTSFDVAKLAYNAEPICELLELAQHGELRRSIAAAVEMKRDECDNLIDLSEYSLDEAVALLKSHLRTEVAETHYGIYGIN